MHCDRVFAILTRGPFPSGASTDVAVEIHLAHCVECRRLAEALRPLDRQKSADEALSLPGYRGDHPQWHPSGEPSRTELLQASQRVLTERRRARPGVQFGRIAAATAVGIAIGVIWCTVGLSRPSEERSYSMTAASMGGRHDGQWNDARIQAQLLHGLDLPLACRKLDMQLFGPLSADERWPARLSGPPPSFINQCCTQCHVAGGRMQLGQARRSLVISSCAICHSDSARR
jgi:hypothetical protein